VVLPDTGARFEKCARLDAEDFAITARTGEVRLHGKGDEVRSVPLAGGAQHSGPGGQGVRSGRPNSRNSDGSANPVMSARVRPCLPFSQENAAARADSHC
jgi:hypothetical protein